MPHEYLLLPFVRLGVHITLYLNSQEGVHMPMNEDETRWVTVKILRGLKEQIDEFCQDQKNGFANSTQYIQHVLKNDLDSRIK